jgi:hypothetical protein
MAQVEVNAYPIHERFPGGHTISFDLTSRSPSKRYDIKNVDDAKAALADFAMEMAKTQKAWEVSVRFDKRSGRKPAGFDKADRARELQCLVNLELAPMRKY